MNTRKLICIMAVALVLGTTVEAQDERAYIGVRLDSVSLPGLLTKHLGLKPGQGIRIRNVNADSPAEKIGLERDDIIIGFQGQEVMDLDRFVEAVQTAGVGAEVSLEIIHLGKRQELKFQLEPPQGKLKWKYPSEPEVSTTWRPGKIFSVAPDGEDWVEVRVDEIPETNELAKQFFNQLYTYHYSSDGQEYTISIEGDPRDDDTPIVVHVGNTAHTTTIGNADTLPEAYRDSAREAIASARQSAQGRREKIVLPRPSKPEVYRRYFENLAVPQSKAEFWLQKKDQVLEKLETQMEQLQQRVDQLEQRHREILDRLLEQRKERLEGDGAADEEAAAPDSESESAI